MYSIKAVSQATGLTVETLRAWERRYRVVVPRRDDLGRRVYWPGRRAAAATPARSDRARSPDRPAGADGRARAGRPAARAERPPGGAGHALRLRRAHPGRRRGLFVRPVRAGADARDLAAVAGTADRRRARAAAARSGRALALGAALDRAGTHGVGQRAQAHRPGARFVRPQRARPVDRLRHAARRAARTRPADVGDDLREPRLQGALPRRGPAAAGNRPLRARGRGRDRGDQRGAARRPGRAARTARGHPRGDWVRRSPIWIGGQGALSLDQAALPANCVVIADRAELEQRLDVLPR